MNPARTSGLEFLSPPSLETTWAALSVALRAWFERRLGVPTTAQRLAWPALAAGKNLFLSSPTGSGKTLAAFLPILDRLGHDESTGTVRCLYVTPLKALGNDVCRTLRACLEDLPGERRPIRVVLRTGDASARARRRLPLEPPDVLLTTPESLAVLLSQSTLAALFGGLRWVVVDELHALAPTKRGADLALSLERLEALTAVAPQRIGLSATCTPLPEAARFLVGAERPCAVGAVAETDRLHLAIEPLGDTAAFLPSLVARLKPELEANAATLIFTNTRSLAERLTWALARQFPQWTDRIGIHHSSLAAGRRREVEARLKRGELRAVVSSTSLELGIDMGPVDAVVLVHPPGEVMRMVQRVGRAGHGPQRLRRGLILTATAAELLEAAVTGASSRGGQYEPLRIPAYPLDVLCQHLLGMAAQASWSSDEAFALVRRAYPYRDLLRSDFVACTNYLSGRRNDGRPWLPFRLHWKGDRFTILDPRTARVLRRNIGTILGEEPRPVRLMPRNRRDRGRERAAPERDGFQVGEVEEAFADRLQPGDRFLLGGQCLEFRGTAGPALLVEEVVGRPVVPRWPGDGWPLSAALAARLYLLRNQAAEALRDGSACLARLLREEYGLGEPAVGALAAYFERQESISEIPTAATLLIEMVGTDVGTDYYFHTPLNRLANDALARVAVRRLVRGHGLAVSSVVADLGLLLSIAESAELSPDEWRAILDAAGFEADLTEAVADSITLRERFRRVALTGLMLLRNPLGARRRVGGPDWAERRLFDRLRADEPDFVLLRQARREVWESCCDAPAARAFLAAMPRRMLRLRRLGGPSPFAEAWTQPAVGPVGGTDTPHDVLQRLHAALTDSGDPCAGSHRLAPDA